MKVTVVNKAIAVCVLVVFCLLTGCEKRELTEPTPRMDIADQFWIKVLLFDNIRQCQLTAESGFSVIDAATQSKVTFGKSSKPINIGIQAGTIVIGAERFGKEVLVQPEKPFIFTVNGTRYRGNLRLSVNADGSSFDVINIVPVEAYLGGVVGAEMPHYWEPEALKAQAIAARTYCLYIKRKVSNRNWHVRRTQAHQVYKGLAAEAATVWNAVNDTAGQVLVCRGKDGTEAIFPTYYSSTCAGHTESSANVFGDSYESLRGVPCPYCKSVTKMSFYFWPMVEFDAEKVSSRIISRYRKLRKLDKIKTIEPIKVSDYGTYRRIISVKLTGENGKIGFLRGEDLRLTIDPTGKKIKSTTCEILKIDGKFRFYNGRGYGHGVGMCQCGAEGMARSGKTAEAILAHYYPGSKIVKLY